MARRRTISPHYYTPINITVKMLRLICISSLFLVLLISCKSKEKQEPRPTTPPTPEQKKPEKPEVKPNEPRKIKTITIDEGVRGGRSENRRVVTFSRDGRIYEEQYLSLPLEAGGEPHARISNAYDPYGRLIQRSGENYPLEEDIYTIIYNYGTSGLEKDRIATEEQYDRYDRLLFTNRYIWGIKTLIRIDAYKPNEKRPSYKIYYSYDEGKKNRVRIIHLAVTPEGKEDIQQVTYNDYDDKGRIVWQINTYQGEYRNKKGVLTEEYTYRYDDTYLSILNPIYTKTTVERPGSKAMLEDLYENKKLDGEGKPILREYMHKDEKEGRRRVLEQKISYTYY